MQLQLTQRHTQRQPHTLLPVLCGPLQSRMFHSPMWWHPVESVIGSGTLLRTHTRAGTRTHMSYTCTQRYTHLTAMQENTVWIVSGYDSLLTMTHLLYTHSRVHTHIQTYSKTQGRKRDTGDAPISKNRKYGGGCSWK